jgi:hypothetical protein
MFCFVL